MGEDVLSLLLPEATEGERARIRRVVTALRLLRDDARAIVGRRVDPSWRSARGELERLERTRRLRAVEAVVHTQLSTLRTADSFLDLGPRPMEYGAAWRVLLTSLVPGAESLPLPDEGPRVVVERLLDA